MADERPAVDPIQAIADLQRELADMRSTLAAQILRRPTGDVEPTMRSTAKDGTLLCNGATVSRATYAALWAWVQEQALAGAGKPFGVGDGSTTFVLPDLRDRAWVGASATRLVGTLFGAATDSVALGAANLPQHNHPISGGISGVGDHDHFIAFAGSHNGHNYSGTTSGGTPWPYGTEPDGNHNHAMNWNGAHSHGHNLSVGNAGQANPTALVIDTIPPSFAGNWLIWT